MLKKHLNIGSVSELKQAKTMTAAISKLGLYAVVVIFVWLVPLTVSSGTILLNRPKRYIEWGPDIVGPYCETRRGGCCPGRIDTCSVPILDSLCYCDEFCNRTRGDCCPDFTSFCRGAPEPVRGACEYNGRPYGPNSAAKINCNQCRCSPDSRSNTSYSWRCDDNLCLIRENIINAVNTRNLGWQASNYSKFWGMTLQEGRQYRLGTHKPDVLVMDMNPIKIQYEGRLPESFDARVRWPGWVHDVRDQGNCAASWAFSTTALAADRLTIESRGSALANLSPQNLLSCNNHGQDGCKGGDLDRAWWFIRKHGVATEDCYPYSSGSTSFTGQCMLARGQTGGLCPSGIPFTVGRVIHATPPYRISMSDEDIMAEIEMNGPVQATFKVKEDFFMYRSGVYSYSRAVPESTPVSEEKYSYHSVRIIGWGVDRIGGRSIKYWLCANSWGKDWGESGYFRIVRGTNECDIESFVLGVWAKVEGDRELRALIESFRIERQRESFRARPGPRSRRHLHRKHKHLTRK